MSENEIAQYVMNNAEDAVTSTITFIARATGTSEASINRFCKKLGFKGFNSFKLALAQENFYSNMKSGGEPEEKIGRIASVSRDYREMLVNTSAMIDEEVLDRAAECLRSANTIHIFGCINTAFTARELDLKLRMVGLNTRTVTDTNAMRMFAASAGEGDLVVAIAPTILTRDIYHSVTAAKDKGARILTITSYDSPKLNALVDFKFVTSDKITTRNALSLSNNLVYLYVVDVLYAALLSGDKILRQKKLNSDALLGINQAADNYLFEY
jgi:DNA-binding MurR/RpiR family transcriptional regulator